MRTEGTGASRPLRDSERDLIGLELFTGISAVVGGSWMLSHPESALPVHDLHGTVFSSWQWPGLALLVLVGFGSLFVALATAVRWSAAPLAHVILGAGLVAWIVLEAAWVAVSIPLQLTIGAMGVAIVVLGLRQHPLETLPVRHHTGPPRRPR